MSKYALRVELNGYPPSDKYEELHEVLARCRFVRTIVGDDGTTCALPNAMYVGQVSTDDIVYVRDRLRAIIASVWSDYEMIVFKYDDAAWVLCPLN